jgi:hypothetical protein
MPQPKPEEASQTETDELHRRYDPMSRDALIAECERLRKRVLHELKPDCTGGGAMKLEYCLGSGSMGVQWAEAGERTAEFLDRAVESLQDPKLVGARKATREQIMQALERGAEVSIGEEFDAKIRCAEATERRRAARLATRPQIEMVKCDCGHTVARSLVMSASLGSSCADCYDRMSN